MNIRKRVFFVPIASFIVSISLFFGCGPKAENIEDEIEDMDTIKTTVLNVGGQLFSIPSPAETAILVQKSGITYDKNVLSTVSNVNGFSTDFSRALILGVYGADLGYVSLYNQVQDAISYLGAVKLLSDKLGLSKAFDSGTMSRLKNNITHKDSMMVLVSLAYQSSDTYLKNNQRNDLSCLILSGGWIEGMHFSVMANKSNPSDVLRYRIAEQKQALQSILAVLKKNQSAEFQKFTVKFEELSKLYEGVKFKYTYVAPVTDSLKKITYLNSTTEVNFEEELMNEITNKIEEIRTHILNISKS